MRNIPWQARDILAVFEKLDRRPGDNLSVRVLWHNVLRGEAIATGVKWLVDAGYVSLNPEETIVTLTEAGYRVITGEEPETSREEPAPPLPPLLAAKSPIRRAVMLTALDIETRALLRHIPDWREEAVRGTVFFRGEVEGWDIAIAEVGPGNNPAAAIAERALQHFDPRVAFFVGVAGGVKDVQVGDVVVATKVYGYERGKESGKGFLPRADVQVAAHGLDQRARATQKRDRWKQRLDLRFSNEKGQIHVAPIAAGEKVLASMRGPVAEFVRENYSDAVAVEMEGRGFLEGVHINPSVEGCVIRGISDLLDGKAAAEASGSQRRAADAAAAVALEMLSGLDGGPGTRPTPTMVPKAEPQRIPLTDLRTWAVEAGWCSDVQSATVGDNDWWSFTNRLRQAAVDSAITFWGKKYVYDYGQELDSEPLVKIPPQHFEEFGFDPTRVAEVDNYDIFTGKLGDPPSAWRGRTFRDLHVDAEEARAWLKGDGAPPAGAEIAVGLNTTSARIGDFVPVCSLVISNVGAKDFDACFVEMIEFSGVIPEGMPMPFVMRTDDQIRSGERGRFTLSRGQKKIVPLAFRAMIRANEWFLFDENGKKYFVPANPTKMIVRIYGGTAPGNALIYLDTDAGWNVFPSVKTIPSDLTLKDEIGPGLLPVE
jgi:nucleoside phosphorylase